VSTARVPLRDRRFAVRFLGRPGAWVWMAAAGLLCVGAWLAFGVPSRDALLGRRAWFLWSGNGLLAMFVVTLAFSLRRWSIKLPRVRDHRRTPAAAVEASGIELEELNQRVRSGAYAGEAEIGQAAADLLARLGVRSLRPVLERDGDRVTGVRLEKREPFGRLETWLEMHIGVGTIACAGVLFHADFVVRHPLGWTMVLLSAVVLVSGVAGIVLYRVVPPLLSRADAGIPFEEATVARQSYQECIVGVLSTVGPAERKALAPAGRAAATGPDLERRNRALVENAPADLAPLPRDLAVMAGSRDRLGASTARARRLAVALRLWKWVHVPVSLVLCFAVLLHILSVLYF
jgi:hypothetical protein